MVDGAIVMIENAHKHLEKWEREGRQGSRNDIIIGAAKEVGKPLFFSLLIIAVSFIPVFTLVGQEGRLFRPLAFTKTFSMAFAALLSVTLVPVLMLLFIRGKVATEAKNPINRFLVWVYEPVAHLALRFPKTVLLLAATALVLTAPAFMRLGSEFMPPLYEGSLLYMPSGLPGMSIAKAAQVTQLEDKIIKQFPEVLSVFGKAGRARTSTDPAPLEMGESTITLKPEDQWPKGMTPDKLVNKLDAALKVTGVSNSWTMPIKGRTDMLSTGIRTPIGIKIFGPDLNVTQQIGEDIENALRDMPGTRNVFAERVVGGYYEDFKIDRDAIARYGLTVEDVEDVVETAIGGKNISTTIEGRERFPINVRYLRDFRTDPQALDRVLVAAPGGAQIPITQLAKINLTMGPPVIKSENAELVGYVYVDVTGGGPRYVCPESDAGSPAEGQDSAGLPTGMERPMGVHAASKADVEIRYSAHTADHHGPAVLELQVHRQDGDRHALGSIRSRWRDLAGLLAPLQHKCRRLGRVHRLGWSSCRDRRRDDRLFGRSLRSTHERRQNDHGERPV